jgi:hypothetical protein
MAPIPGRFIPGFPPGAGFPGEEFAPAWLKLPLEHLLIREKMLSGESCSKEIRESEVRLL